MSPVFLLRPKHIVWIRAYLIVVFGDLFLAVRLFFVPVAASVNDMTTYKRVEDGKRRLTHSITIFFHILLKVGSLDSIYK